MQLPTLPIDSWLAEVADASDEDLEVLADWQQSRHVWDALWSLRAATDYKPFSVQVETVERIHRRLHSSSFESSLWGELLAKCGFSLPDWIAHDLLDRNIAIGAVFRSTPTVQILRRVSKDDSQAAWRLACILLSSDQYSPDDVRQVLQTHAHHHEMMRSLATIAVVPGPKEGVLLQALASQANGAELVRLRQMRNVASTIAHLDGGEIDWERLYRTQDPHILRELAAHPSAPIHILTALAASTRTKFAKQIRSLAAENLAQRGQSD